jgi:asparagine synthase (glutamine-hydrolysing)
MCGIVAEHGGSDTDTLERMLDRLTHRGPDDSGHVEVGDAWLGHRRLSIVDVDGGRQPLVTDGEGLWLVGNGEVYNHAELRAELEGDEEWSSDSDNEVALHLVDREGPAALGRLNGMFAFALAGADGRFVAARDPVGIKPLYWAERDGVTRFASEMHVFDEEWQALVEPFPPGCAWTPDGGLERFAAAVEEDLEPFAGPGAQEQGSALPDWVVDGTREALVHAVERQLMGDVPVGVFLSGGLDSSLVAAIAAPWLRERGRTLETFAVGTRDSPDLEAARRVAEHVGSDHHEAIYTADDAIEALPVVVRAIESFDPGLVRSAVPNFLLARFTARRVKVVLTGEGADELFAGYEYLRDFTDADELHAELVRTVRSLHNLNLQRCDRVTMAHGLEARVPFLDREVIDWALRLPAGYKLSRPGQLEKRLLREAFTGWLPDDLLWRVKAEFGDGSGARDVLSEVVAGPISDEEFEGERFGVEPPLRSKEELAYYRIFREHLAGVRAEVAISRFATA